MSTPIKPIKVFISYAHEGESYLETLHTHLSLLKHEGLIATWYGRQIIAGMDWVKAIDTHLETASLILPLVSADFLIFGYCYEKEMQRVLELAESRRCMRYLHHRAVLRLAAYSSQAISSPPQKCKADHGMVRPRGGVCKYCTRNTQSDHL
jgi:hypothetical protein